MKFPKITLLITTYNWTEALERVLDGVRQQTVLPDEVVIADDGSCTDTKDYIDHIRNIFPVPIQHVWHEDEGFRRTIILNKAIAASKGDYIIEIDGRITGTVPVSTFSRNNYEIRRNVVIFAS